MRRFLLLPLAILQPTFAAAQVADEIRPDQAPAPRSFAITVGAGTSMGWFGAQAERYFRGERMSFFAGLGYAFAAESDHPEGPAVAAGLRRFTDGPTHRGYLGLAIARLATSASHFQGELVERGQHYGPAALVGYQYTADRGFTVLAGLGVGYAPGLGGDGGDPITPTLELGFGYTWR